MINTLTSLRFIFALMVFGAHCYTIDKFFDTHFFKEGFVGVSFFFVLSGFIIAYNYQKRFSENKITKRAFLGSTHRTYLSLALADSIYRRRLRKLCHCVRSNRLAQTLLSFTHINKCLYSKSRLLFLIQQPFVEFMLRTAILPLLPIPDTHSKGL